MGRRIRRGGGNGNWRPGQQRRRAVAGALISAVREFGDRWDLHSHDGTVTATSRADRSVVVTAPAARIGTALAACERSRAAGGHMPGDGAR